MIRVSVFYPQTPGATFDHTYYAQRHCPMVQEKLRAFGCVRIEIDKGLCGGTPDAPAPFPDGPGLGITRREDALQKYPPLDKVLDTPLGYDGSAQDR